MRGFKILVLVCLWIPASLSAQIPAWMTEVTGYEQPEWFNSQRVQIHSRVSRYFKDPDNALYAHWAKNVVKALGANTFTRHIKTDESPLYWKSAWGNWAPIANSRNIIQEAIKEAHQNNTHMIGYYNHYTDSYIRDKYPSYRCKDVTGKDVVKKGRGTMLCFNSPYTDSVAIRLIEFAKMGGDGIYFDEIHMPREGCWCENCKTKFKAQTGHDAPTTIDVNSTLYKKYQDFNNQSILEAFNFWREKLKEVNPNLVMIIGSNTLPRLDQRHLNTDLFRLANAHKTEWDIPVRTLTNMPAGIAVPNKSVWRGLGYTFDRDIADGRPAHIWVPGMSFVPANQVLAATAGLISFGHIANLDIFENLAPDLDFVPAIKYGNTVGSAMIQAKPLRWMLVHYSDAALEEYVGTNRVPLWKKFLSNLYGGYYVAQEQKYPVGIITDSQIEQGLFQGANVLFLPNREGISPAMQRKINEFKAAGGTVIEANENWKWYAAGAPFDQANQALNEVLSSVKARPLMESTAGSGFYYANYFSKKNGNNTVLLAAYSNDLNWIVTPHSKAEADELVPACVQPQAIKNIILTVLRAEKPLSVKRVETGENLKYQLEKGKLKVQVPAFQEGSLIEITYSK
ncbi:hypothetical protein [Pedobacter sp. MW01-1-1]|uniref:hypothetical protein n=1 Tax=Pedobacter sp. MW01-1-1 TaxID=3383027 RepID=UPI003FF0ED5C